METDSNQEQNLKQPGVNKPKAISLARGTAVVSSLTLLSRILGFVRDLLIARGFGSSAFSDCFFVAFRIPNLLRSFIAEGALSSAFVPVFADSLHRSETEARQTIKRVSGFLIVCTGLLSILGIIFAPQIVAYSAPGFQSNASLMELCIELTRYMLPIILCVSLVAMLNGALNSLGNFGAAAWSQVWMNIVLIFGAVAALWQSPTAGVRLLAISAAVGSIIQVLVQIPALSKFKISIFPSFTICHPEIKKLVKLMVPAIVGATVYQLGIFLNTVLASLLPHGSVSSLYYADRLVQFPIGTFSIALASVLMPALSISHASGDASSFDKKTFSALRFTSFFILPVAGIIFTFAEPLTKFLFERGSFSSNDTAMTAAVVQMYALGIWSVSSHSLFARTFLARKDTVTNTLVGIGSLAINFVTSLLVIGPISAKNNFSQSIASFQQILFSIFPSASMGPRGLGLASACGSLFSIFVLAFLSAKFLKQGWKEYFICTLKSLIATLIMVVVIFNLPKFLEWNFYLALSVKLAVACLVLFLSFVLLRSEELFEVRALLKKRFFK